MKSTRLVMSLFAVLSLALVGPALAGGKKAALKLLHQIEQVDGTGSGLNADTLQGMTPAQLTASGKPGPQGPPGPPGLPGSSDATTLQGLSPAQIVAQNIAAAIMYVTALGYGEAAQITLGPGLCDCALVACADGNDFRVNCGGGFLPFPGVQGSLTALGAVPGTFNECGACGCNVSGSPATLAVSEVCLAVP
jgi:hypothetical protein